MSWWSMRDVGHLICDSIFRYVPRNRNWCSGYFFCDTLRDAIWRNGQSHLDDNLWSMCICDMCSNFLRSASLMDMLHIFHDDWTRS